MISWEMIEDWLATGDEETFREIVQAVQPLLRSICRRRFRDPNDVNDCVQDAVCIALTFLRQHGIAGLDLGRVTVKSFFCMRLKDALSRRLKKSQAKMRRGEQNWSSIWGEDGCAIEEACERNRFSRSSVTPAQAVIRQERHVLLWQALFHLPDELQDIVFLKDLEEYTFAEVAEVLGIPPGTVVGRHRRARSQLRELLQEKMDGEAPCSS